MLSEVTKARKWRGFCVSAASPMSTVTPSLPPPPQSRRRPAELTRHGLRARSAQMLAGIAAPAMFHHPPALPPSATPHHPLPHPPASASMRASSSLPSYPQTRSPSHRRAKTSTARTRSSPGRSLSEAVMFIGTWKRGWDETDQFGGEVQIFISRLYMGERLTRRKADAGDLKQFERTGRHKGLKVLANESSEAPVTVLEECGHYRDVGILGGMPASR
ncbi:hypothetical protein C8R44DRAFT_732011 [Mycena epipterygia]|nr:hypothetical protein C8R44DRAFT_732011 [Mycena epipterygia]